jgi:hypothetical protein
MRPDPEMIPILIDTAKTLKASQRRLFMAKTVAAMGRGGQLWAEAISAGTGRRSARGCTSCTAA